MKELSNKIVLAKPSEATIAFNLGVKLLSNNVEVDMEYYVKGTECRNARFDIVLYDKKTLELLAVVEVKRSRSCHVELVTSEKLEYHTKQIQRYFRYLEKYKIPLFLVRTSREKTDLVASAIRKFLKY